MHWSSVQQLNESYNTFPEEKKMEEIDGWVILHICPFEDTCDSFDCKVVIFCTYQQVMCRCVRVGDAKQYRA